MFNPDSKDEAKPPRSLLALSRGGAQPRVAAPSLLAAAPKQAAPAPERHRLARSRREAAPSPLLAALAAKPERPATAEQPEASSGTRLQAALSEARARADRGPSDRPATEAPVAESTAEDWSDWERAPEPASDGAWRPLVDPMKIVGGVSKSRWIILVSTVAGALIGIALALSTPKKYESVAEILVDPRDIKVSERNVTEGSLPSDATLAIVENQVKVLTSGTVLDKVVDELHLENDTEFNGQADGFGLGRLISEVRSILSRSESGAGNVRRALAVRNLAESLEVERAGKTFVVSVSAITQDAAKSALIANTVTDVFLKTYGDIQSDTAGRASDELTSRLAELQAGLEAAERKVEAYKAENDLVDAQGRLISDDEMVKLNDQLAIARARTIELNARAASARNLDLNAVAGGELPEQLASPVMAELRTQYATIKQETERLAAKLGPRHPERQAAEAQLAGARDSLAGELRRIVSSIQVELKRAVQLEQDLASRLAQLKARQNNVSEDLVTLRELERDASAKRAVYESFLLRARETGEQRGLNTANVSVISKAQPPLEPLGPSRTTTVLATTVLGFFAGIGFGGLRGAVESLRGGNAPRPAQPQRIAMPRLPVRRRKPVPDEIDRIMQKAVGGDAAPPATDAPKPEAAKPAETAAPEPTAPKTASRQDETRMNPAYPYPYPQQSPQAEPRPAQWSDPHAAWAAQQEAMRQHAANQAALQQAAWHEAAMRAGYPQPQYAPQLPMNYPQPMAYPPQQAPYGAYPQPQPMPYAAQPPMAYPQHYANPYPQPAPAWQQPQQAYAPPQPARPEPSPMDDIRESLREFREAVRDLADRRSRKDY